MRRLGKSGLGGQNIAKALKRNHYYKEILTAWNIRCTLVYLYAIMLPNIIFCAAVSLAVIAVALLALFSPVPNQKGADNHQLPGLALSLYVQQPHVGGSALHRVAESDAGAFIFRRTLTEGPDNTSRVIGKAQGFIIPIQRFEQSEFNIIYLTFETRRFSGSLSVHASDLGEKGKTELPVVGGTGSFAFARGVAVFGRSDDSSATYHIELHLKYPNRWQTIQGIG